MTSRKTFQAQHDHPPSCKPFCGMSWRRWIACWNQVRGEGHKPQQNSAVYLLLQWAQRAAGGRLRVLVRRSASPPRRSKATSCACTSPRHADGSAASDGSGRSPPRSRPRPPPGAMDPVPWMEITPRPSQACRASAPGCGSPCLRRRSRTARRSLVGPLLRSQ